jgi:N6-L-threonylcarbamoyladenine synthase
VLSNVTASQVDIHARYGGVFPEIASRAHVRAIVPVVEMALSGAGVALQDIAAIAVTYGPGLSGSLLVGVNTAKGLSLATGKRMIGVNHLEGHLYSNWLHADGRVRTPAEYSPYDDPVPPILCLIVSGGHSELAIVEDHGHYRVLGRTLDDAAGEAFDKIARLLDLGYPGGPPIERAARDGDARAFDFPRAETTNPCDFSFSGLKTAVLREVEAHRTRATALPIADLAASFQEAVCDALVQRVERALDDAAVTEVHISGGVSANTRLRSVLAERIDKPIRYPPLVLCTDNAAMIAAAGHWALEAGRLSDLSLDVEPGLRLGNVA